MRKDIHIETDEFERNGFAIVPDVVRRETISDLVAAIERVKEEHGVRRGAASYAIRNLPAKVPAVKTLAETSPVRELVNKVLEAEPMLVRGLLFDKTPSANWNVAWHQDLLIAVRERRDVAGYGPWSLKEGVPHVQPPAKVLEKMVTLRLHLDDCGEDNGPLRVLPGSHRTGILATEQIDAWRGRHDPVACLVPSGGVLLMCPLLLHASSAAKQPGHRRVVHLEFAAGELADGLEWDV